MARGKYRRRAAARAAAATPVPLEPDRHGDWYVDTWLEKSAGSLNHYTGPPVIRGQRTGKRKTSWRRRAELSHITMVHTLAGAAGKDPIDRHKPYVYGASKRKLRRPIFIALAQEGIEP